MAQYVTLNSTGCPSATPTINHKTVYPRLMKDNTRTIGADTTSCASPGGRETRLSSQYSRSSAFTPSHFDGERKPSPSVDAKARTKYLAQRAFPKVRPATNPSPLIHTPYSQEIEQFNTPTTKSHYRRPSFTHKSRIASESIQPGKHHRLSPENAINPSSDDLKRTSSTRNPQDTQIPAAIGMFNGQLPEIDSFGFKTLVKGDSPVVE